MRNLNQKKALLLLGKKIKSLRRKQGISQAQLGFEVGISREQITRIESGKINTTFFTLYKIASTLDVEFEELVSFLK